MLRLILFLSIEFIRVTLVSKIIKVSGAQFYNPSSVHYILCLPPQDKSPSITIYPPIHVSSSPNPNPLGSHHPVVCVHEFFSSFLLISPRPCNPDSCPPALCLWVKSCPRPHCWPVQSWVPSHPCPYPPSCILSWVILRSHKAFYLCSTVFWVWCIIFSYYLNYGRFYLTRILLMRKLYLWVMFLKSRLGLPDSQTWQESVADGRNTGPRGRRLGLYLGFTSNQHWDLGQVA